MRALLIELTTRIQFLFALRVLARPSKINKAWVVGQRQRQGFVDEYLKLIADGIASQALAGPRLVIILTASTALFWNCKLVPVVVVNLEHTLVLPGGRDSSGAPSGQVASIHDKSEKYLVRLPDGRRGFESADSIVDYSQSNISNVMRSPFSDLYAEKALYIAPLLRKTVHLDRSNRDISSVFTLMSLAKTEDRRAEIVNQMSTHFGMAFTNLTDLRSSSDVRLQSMGIMLNLHQTDHHHTLEELRILPALMSGVLVVSEPSPLIETVPYASFVRFAELSDMGDVLSGLLVNFEAEWDATFGNGGFLEAISSLQGSNSQNFESIARRLQGRGNRDQ